MAGDVSRTKTDWAGTGVLNREGTASDNDPIRLATGRDFTLQNEVDDDQAV